MTGVSYRRSAELAAIVGPYGGYAENAEPHQPSWLSIVMPTVRFTLCITMTPLS
ncbi:ribonucleotide reductase [Cutibacterium acnes JCM 18909]|nr:ribonucleotide reductase [Cutibacterium acnes JCM 18909]